jgi:hypothetical protein
MQPPPFQSQRRWLAPLILARQHEHFRSHCWKNSLPKLDNKPAYHFRHVRSSVQRRGTVPLPPSPMTVSHSINGSYNGPQSSCLSKLSLPNTIRFVLRYARIPGLRTLVSAKIRGAVDRARIARTALVPFAIARGAGINRRAARPQGQRLRGPAVVLPMGRVWDRWEERIRHHRPRRGCDPDCSGRTQPEIPCG